MDWTDIARIPAVGQVLGARKPQPVTRPANYRSYTTNTVVSLSDRESEQSRGHNALMDLFAIAPVSEGRRDEVNMNSVSDEIEFYETHKRLGVAEPKRFWTDHAFDLPRLASIASRIMSVIPSSAATERMFSQSKRIQGLRRTQMAGTVLEDQVIIVSNPDLIQSAYDSIKDWEIECTK